MTSLLFPNTACHFFRGDLVRFVEITYHSKPAFPFGTLYGILKIAVWIPAQGSGLTSTDNGRKVLFEKLMVA